MAKKQAESENTQNEQEQVNLPENSGSEIFVSLSGNNSDESQDNNEESQDNEEQQDSAIEVTSSFEQNLPNEPN